MQYPIYMYVTWKYIQYSTKVLGIHTDKYSMKHLIIVTKKLNVKQVWRLENMGYTVTVIIK